MNDDQRGFMEEEARQNNPSADDHDPDMDKDDRMFHPDQVSRLAEDGAPPAAPPRDVPGGQLSLDHPQTDTNIDSDEAYDVGIGNASGVNTSHEDSSAVERVIDEDENAHGRFQ